MPAVLMPVLVASRAASRSGSNWGSKLTVKAQSMMRPSTCVPKSTFITSPCCDKRRDTHRGAREQSGLRENADESPRIFEIFIVEENTQPRRTSDELAQKSRRTQANTECIAFGARDKTERPNMPTEWARVLGGRSTPGTKKKALLCSSTMSLYVVL